MHRERCPRCGSDDIRGGAMDLNDGDEMQDRYCHACNFLASWRRSVGTSESWWGPPAAPPPREMSEIEEQLLAEVYAAPDDDGPRLVYADWLIERGDPRGTFIAFQCRGGDGQALLDQHWRSWIGAPSALVMHEHVEFERGFWSACDRFDVVAPRLMNRKLAHDPAWGTVRRVTIDDKLEPYIPLLLDGPLRKSVRSMRVRSRSAVGAIQIPLDELVLWHEPDPAPPALPKLPPVKRLGFHCNSRRATRWLDAAVDAGIRDFTFWLEPDTDNIRKLLRRSKHAVFDSMTIVINEAIVLRVSDHAIRAVELPASHVATLSGLGAARLWLTQLAKHAAPAPVGVPELAPDIVERAAALGLELVALPPPTTLRPLR